MPERARGCGREAVAWIAAGSVAAALAAAAVGPHGGRPRLRDSMDRGGSRSGIRSDGRSRDRVRRPRGIRCGPRRHDRTHRERQDDDRRAAQVHEPSREGEEPLPPPARAQSRGLVPVGTRGVRARAARGQADLPLDRLLDLPLVPRHGARIVRERGDREGPQRALRLHQGGPRGAPGHRPDLHGGRHADDGERRLADDRLPDARPAAVLRRDLFPARRPGRAPRHRPPGARRVGGVARQARRSCSPRRRASPRRSGPISRAGEPGARRPAPSGPSRAPPSCGRRRRSSRGATTRSAAGSAARRSSRAATSCRSSWRTGREAARRPRSRGSRRRSRR